MPKKRKATRRKTTRRPTAVKKRKRRRTASAVVAPKRRRRSMKRSTHRKRRSHSISRGSRMGGGIVGLVLKGALAGAGAWAIFAGTGKIAKMLNLPDSNKTLLRIAGIGGAMLLLPKVLPRQKDIIQTAGTAGIAIMTLMFIDKMLGSGVLAGDDVGEYSPDDVQARLIAQNLDVQGYLPSSGLLGDEDGGFMMGGVLEGVLEGSDGESDLY